MKRPKGQQEAGHTCSHTDAPVLSTLAPLPNNSLSVALGITRPGGWDSQPAPGSKTQVAEQPRRLQITGWVEQRHWDGLRKTGRAGRGTPGFVKPA